MILGRGMAGGVVVDLFEGDLGERVKRLGREKGRGGEGKGRETQTHESRRVSGSDSGTSVTNGLVRDLGGEEQDR